MKTGEKEEVEFIDIQPLQFVARAVRVLGNRNILCFCHDNVVRICHINRGMKGHSPDKLIEVGDIILVSVRDLTPWVDTKLLTPRQLEDYTRQLEDRMKTIRRGDVIAKYPPEQVRHFKKEGAYSRLFLKLEDAKEVGLDALGEEIGSKILDSMNEEDDVFEHGEESESEEEAEEETKIVDKREKVNHRAGGREVREAHEIKQAEKDVTFDEL